MKLLVLSFSFGLLPALVSGQHMFRSLCCGITSDSAWVIAGQPDDILENRDGDPSEMTAKQLDTITGYPVEIHYSFFNDSLYAINIHFMDIGMPPETGLTVYKEVVRFYAGEYGGEADSIDVVKDITQGSTASNEKELLGEMEGGNFVIIKRDWPFDDFKVSVMNITSTATSSISVVYICNATIRRMIDRHEAIREAGGYEAWFRLNDLIPTDKPSTALPQVPHIEPD